MKSAAICVAILFALNAPVGAQVYRPAEMIEWKVRSFEGRTDYATATGESIGTDHAAVRAECRRRQASGLVLEREHDLAEAPILEWRWRVDSIYPAIDETEKSGDDFPARVYVVAERWPKFRSRAINYVWSSTQAAGTSWENPFAGQFMMVAVRSGPNRLGEWVTERRNVLDDFRRLHDLEPESIDALAIMTDCDNAGGETTAWYGPIRWLTADG
jgi:hypothetical protein